MLTYNHDRYLGQALDGVLAQRRRSRSRSLSARTAPLTTRVTFSTLRRAVPGRPWSATPGGNLGTMANFQHVFAHCRGRDVALLEGDDYWTDPDKFRRQVDVLERDRTSTVCFHNVRVFHESGAVPDRLSNPPWEPACSTMRDLIAKNFMETCSVLYRRDAIDELPAWWNTLPVGDGPTHSPFAHAGSIAYLSDVMGAYRVHGGGVWSLSSLTRRCQANIDVAERLNRHFEFAYDAEFTRAQLGFALTIERHALTPAERSAARQTVDALLDRLRRRRPAGARAALEVRGGRAGLSRVPGRRSGATCRRQRAAARDRRRWRPTAVSAATAGGRTLYRAAAILGPSSAIGAIASALAAKRYALFLGAAGFGVYGLLQSLFMLSSMFASLGVNASVVRLGASALAGHGGIRPSSLRRAAWEVTISASLEPSLYSGCCGPRSSG